MEALQHTCLYQQHVALGAQMSPFGGFMMPIQYSSILEEHEAVRGAAGLFDVSHMGEIFVSGPQAEAYINHIFTGDVSHIPAGKIVYGMMLYPDGGVVDDLLVHRMQAPDTYLLVVNAANIAKDEAWMRQQAASYDVCIDNQSSAWGQLALQGPDAEHLLTTLLGTNSAEQLSFYTFAELTYEGEPLLVSRTGYTGEDGFELYTTPQQTVNWWNRILQTGKVKPCGLGCRDTLRFEVGLPLYGHELSAEISPLEAGLGFFVKMDKPEFIGRTALIKQKAEGLQRRLVGIELHEGAIPRADYPIETSEGTIVGHVTTGYRSPSLNKSVCMALVDTAHAALGTELYVRIRKKAYAGTVCKKKFYEKHYKQNNNL